MNNFLLTARMLLCKYLQQPLFIVKINNGKVIKFCGKVRPGFLADCNEIAERNNLESGFLMAVKNGEQKALLKGSYEIPAAVLQQCRNVWGFGS